MLGVNRFAIEMGEDFIADEFDGQCVPSILFEARVGCRELYGLLLPVTFFNRLIVFLRQGFHVFTFFGFGQFGEREFLIIRKMSQFVVDHKSGRGIAVDFEVDLIDHILMV